MANEPGFIVERHALDQRVWVVFSGREGEDPQLEALVFDQDLAKAMCQAKHPDPEEDGRDLVFDACWEPAFLPLDTPLVVSNDYRIGTHSELKAALPSDKVLSVFDCRPEVQAFAVAMERKLRAHDSVKGVQGWKDADSNRLMSMLAGEVLEVQQALRAVRLVGQSRQATDEIGTYKRALTHECADVSNLAMMLADVAGELGDIDYTRQSEPSVHVVDRGGDHA